MGNRELSVAVCGVVTAVMLMGSIVSQPGAPVGSLMEVAFSTPTPRQLEQSRARAIGDRNLTTTPEENEAAKYPSITDDGLEGGLEPGSVEASEIDPAKCEVAKEVIDEVGSAHNLAVPRSLRNNEARKILSDILDGVLEQYCGEDAVPVKKQRIQKVDNDCERFPEASARYVQCTHEEEQGMNY